MHVTAALLGAVALTALPVQASVHVPRWSSCLEDYSPVADTEHRMDVQTILASIVPGQEAFALGNLPGDHDDVLRLDLFGSIKNRIAGYNSTTEKLSTLFTTTTQAGIMQYTSTSWLCNSIFTPNATKEYIPGNTSYCPLPAGDFGINVSIPLYNVHALTTIHTEVHIVDTSEPANTVACYDVYVVPYEEDSWPFKLFLWLPAAVTISYWIVTWAARFAAGWVISVERGDTVQREATMLKWSTMLISGLSGERLGVSAALLRFVTPGLTDIIHHIQFVTMLGMINVNWPSFFYPIVTQGAWSDLVWNVSIVSTDHPSAYEDNYTQPENFKFMLDDKKYPLYLNDSGEPHILNLDRVKDGMPAFARMVGLRPQDLFGTCLSLFLMLAAIIITFSLLLYVLHWLTEMFGRDHSRPKRSRSATPAVKVANRSSVMSGATSLNKEWNQSGEFSSLPTPPAQRQAEPIQPSRWHRTRRRFSPRGEAGAFHFSALYGNLMRLIVTFHFPVTAFSIYQLTLKDASVVSKVFAALAFVFISVLIPAFIMFKISRTPTGKLYDAARTLLALGTMYNVYEREKQLYRTLPLLISLASGIVIGAAQSNGLAQTVVLVIVELASFVATTFWNPWGQGASMGGVVFLLSIVRIASIIMAMVLSREVNAGGTPGQWLTYVVLLLQAVVFVFFVLMIFTKIVEGLIRLFGGAPFDESNHPIDGGIFAAIMDLGCFDGVRGGKGARRRQRKRDAQLLQQKNASVANSLTTQRMMNRQSGTGFPPVEPEGGHRGSYTAVTNPAVTSVNEFGGRRSMSDQGSMLSVSDDHRIMDAWRPMSFYDTQPLSPSEKTTPLGSPRQGYSKPPSIQVTSDPFHRRSHSSSAMMEVLDTPGYPMANSPPMGGMSASPRMDGYGGMGTPPLYPPTAGVRPDRNGTRPPPLTIPQRASLHSMGFEDDDEERRNKRRSWASGTWFGKAQRPEYNDSDSDDEPGPSRRRRRRRQRHPDELDSDDENTQQPRGWQALFTRKLKVDKKTREARSARKAAAVNISGALLAGLDAPPERTGGVDAAAPTQPPAAGSTFRVQRKGGPPPARPTRSDSGDNGGKTPLLSAPPSSFRVRRKGDPSPEGSSAPPTPTPPLGTPSSLAHVIREEDEYDYARPPPQPTSAPADQPSFRVQRTSGPPSGSSSAVASDSGHVRSGSGNLNRQSVASLNSSQGYHAALFVPLNDRS